MKILLTGLHSGWMGLHLAHFSAGLQRQGIEVIPADYHRMGRLFGFFKETPEKEAERRNRSLEEMIRRFQPDAVLFAGSWKFDLMRLKSYFKGLSIVYDYDGPRRKAPEEYAELKGVDLFLSVSAWLCRELHKRGREAHYLPHGVDTQYYAPVSLSEKDRIKYGASVSYIGRATTRRAELCALLKDQGLALYGERWKKDSDGKRLGLLSNIRFSRDVSDLELVKIYNASDAVLNILQEPLNVYQTILSIQTFAVPASGGCLLSEWTEELPDAFEIGREVLACKNGYELKMQTEKCLHDHSFSKKIGEAGRRRCIAEHTWDHRAKQLRDLLEGS